MTPRDANQPLQFRALGAVDLRTADARDPQPILRGPKRLAVFSYLALAKPHGYHRRDTLLALFWPELSQGRARHALRNVLYLLRRSLGDEVVVTRGDEEVGIALEAVRSDVAAFEEAMEENRFEVALEGYGGDLLDGFFAPGVAPEFEQWLDAERSRLRERAVAAAWTLAELAEAAADPAAAARWGRRAAQLAPLDESAQRRLIAILDRLGDRSGALGCFEALRQRLGEEFELEPAPETQALVESIRAQSGFHPAAEVETDSAESPERRAELPASRPRGSLARLEADAMPASKVAQARRRNRGRRSNMPLQLATVLLGLGLLLGGTWTMWQLRENGTESSGTRIAVLPFTVLGATGHAYLGEGLVDLLSTDLDLGEVRTVSPHALLGFLRREGVGQVDPARARAVSERFGADYYVLGEVLESGGRLRIGASLYDRQRTDPLARVVAEGGEGELQDVVRSLATQLLDTRGGPWGPASRIAARATASMPALRAYLEGERDFRAGHYSAAVDAFQRATAEDTAFALAFYRLSHAAEWDNRFRLALEAAERAVRFADRLHPRERLRLEALLAERRGDAREAERRYRALLGTYPDDPGGWWGLAEVLFHYGPANGRSIAEARSPFERVLDLDPDHREALWHLARIAAGEERYAELDSLVQRIQNTRPEGDLILEMLALRAFAAGGPQEGEQIIGALARATDYPIKATVWNTAVVLSDLVTAERVARLFTEPHRSADVRATGHVWSAHLQVARGNLRQARMELQAVTPLRASTTGLEYEALFLLAPFLAPSRHELEALHARLLDWDAEAVPASVLPNDIFTVHDGLHPLLRSYLLGLVEARLDNPEAALDHARQLGPTESTPEPALANRLARSVRAEVEWLRGDVAAALALLEEPELHAWYGRRMHSPFFSQARERYLRAEALAAQGRHDEALRLFASFAEHSLLDLIFLAPSHLRQAEILAGRGDLARASEHLERCRTLWRDADAELQLGKCSAISHASARRPRP